MSVLRTIESKLESLFEGVFGRAFRTNVQPVELARKLVKEMDDHRTVSVSRVYVPNEYSIYLAPPDREQFADFEESLCDELADYVTEHARREGYVLLTAAEVKLETDADLDMGVFGIATRFVRGATARPQERGRAEAAEPGRRGRDDGLQGRQARGGGRTTSRRRCCARRRRSPSTARSTS